MLVCKECKVEKDFSEFYKHKGMINGCLNICKPCKISYEKNNRSNEKDKLRYRSSPKKRLNVIFHGLMNRCYNVNDSHYKWYGGKGIKVLWKDYKEFYKDMIEEYMKHREINGKIKNRQTQIDRIDNKSNYCKENCRRVNAKENNEYNKF